MLAGICYFLIGAASYLLAATLLGFGGAKLFRGELRVSRRIGWMILFIASGACLFQFAAMVSARLARAFNIEGPGGLVGDFFGRHIFRSAMGRGSVIVLGGIYLTSLILMTGLRPIHLVRQTVLALRRGFVALRLWLFRRKMRKADLKEQLEISQQQIAKQQRAIEKKLRKKGAPVLEPALPFSDPRGICQSPGTESGRHHRAAGGNTRRARNLRSRNSNAAAAKPRRRRLP